MLDNGLGPYGNGGLFILWRWRRLFLLFFQFHLQQHYKKSIFVSIGDARRTVRCASPKLGKEMEIETIRETKMVRETEILREMYIDIVGDGDN